jgi:4-hydroxy-3-polyprenylbenzoate decarboxylase
MHHHGAAHFRKYSQLGKRMDVAVAIGTDPQTLYAATAPLPDGVDEMIFAGFLREQPVELVKCINSDIEVPANAEFVLEGYVDPGEMRTEGPFGDHTGYYSMEDLPIEGVFHNMAFISIDKSIPGHARKVINALWGLGQFTLTKIIVVFDKDVDIQNIKDVIWRLGNNVDPQRDIIIQQGPVDVLNHAAPETGFGSKMGIDATKKTAEEGHKRVWPPVIEMPEEIKTLVTKNWKEYGLD